jgi:hypothetical protein
LREGDGVGSGFSPEADLAKQLVKFANTAATVQSIDDPKTIDDAL